MISPVNEHAMLVDGLALDAEAGIKLFAPYLGAIAYIDDGDYRVFFVNGAFLADSPYKWNQGVHRITFDIGFLEFHTNGFSDDRFMYPEVINLTGYDTEQEAENATVPFWEDVTINDYIVINLSRQIFDNYDGEGDFIICKII